MAKILFKLSGSISAFKAAAVLSRLVQEGHEVQTVATASALRFVGPATLEGLTGKPVQSDAFEPGRMMDHIHLAQWADLVLLCPATAGTLNRLAAGLADDLVGALFLAHDFARKPYLVAPAMNPAMLAHPATQASLARLKSWGVRVLEPESGRMACGDVGQGRLQEPEQILAAVRDALAPASRPARTLRVLVTSGGTREAIDDVRFISNMSTGKTGAAIASILSRAGHEVTLLRAADSALPSGGNAKLESFVSFADLDLKLRALLAAEAFDAVIHAAAVSDYSVEPSRGKIDSSAEELVLRLRRNPKLVDRIKEYSPRPMILVAFKLTSTPDPGERAAALSRLFRSRAVDLAVANDLSEVGAERHLTRIHDRERLLAECATKDALAQALEEILLKESSK